MTETMPPALRRVKKMWCVRCEFRNDRGQTVAMWVQPDEDPHARLQSLLSDRAVFQHFPVDGWILTMELTCPHCGETRLVEKIGPELFCSVCGKAARIGAGDPPAKPAASPRS